MKIHLHDMIFFGYHGVQPEERKLGQRFVVNFTLYTNPELDTRIRRLEDTVDYTKVYEIIRGILETKEYYLLENCANDINQTVMDAFPEILRVRVRIKKPSVPINGSLSSVEVEMERQRT
ncbi:MAG: dihydroneopterin aldolase [Candidatus Cloacimonetes bacterium]|nr:dihydroneopterin aldolase [Candidatus Cloacimonadota bacterium]